ncbi:MAG: TraB/GumN family protein [Emcibacter sp.]|nr:TraB/GumN family protein [Emcibacter sp.]
MIYTLIPQLSRYLLAKSISIFLLGIIILSPPAGAADTEIVNARPALWQVTKGGGTVYLLGSFHILPKNYQWYDGIISRSFEDSDELVMETEMTPEATAGIQATVINNAFFKDDDSLKNHLDEAHYAKMLGYAKKLMGMDEAMAKKSKPWFMAIQISLVSAMTSGMDPNSGVDKFLEGQAKKVQKPISGLETPQESMNALIHHPMVVQAEMLSDTLDKLDDFKRYITSYLEAWASGDGDRMTKTMVEDMSDQPEMYQALLVDRNKNWLPAIEDHINSGKRIFIVVGAAHLVGKDGLVGMLQAKGYRVDKIQ